MAAVREITDGLGVKAIDATHWADGGNGTTDLAEEAVRLADSGESRFRSPVSRRKCRSGRKIETIATRKFTGPMVSAPTRKRVNQIKDLQDARFR